MPVFKQYIGSSCRWGIWKADETVEELLALLPHKEKYEADICDLRLILVNWNG